MILVLQIAAGTMIGLTVFSAWLMVAVPWLADKIIDKLDGLHK